MASIWTLKSIHDLQYYCCPQCLFKVHSKQEFIDHICQNHNEAIDHLTLIRDGSLDDIECVWRNLQCYQCGLMFDSEQVWDN